MRASPKLIEALKLYEGFSSRAYRDSADVWTVGYGFTAGVGPHTVITWGQADARLAKELRAYEDGVISAIGAAAPTQYQFDAMVSLAYNIGIGAFKKSTVAAQFKAGDMASAADAFLKFDKARVSGKLTQLKGLRDRRVKERAMFLGC